MKNQHTTDSNGLIFDKMQLVEKFHKRLIESYGYSKNQIAKNVPISNNSIAMA